MIRFLIVLSLAAASLVGQGTSSGSRGTIQGSVKDTSGGIVRGATVNLNNDAGTVQTTTSGTDGNYTFKNVAPGSYTISSTFKGLQQASVSIVTVNPLQTATANITLVPAAQKEVVNVNDSVNNSISTEPANNQSAIVLSKEDIDALPDDPDDLQADLQALAGPAAGPGGSQIYVDGFTGGRLPPKESIREIRINSNPFSAEFDKIGFGRIQIFTKPGSDKFHGSASYNISDGIWNSRNPFLPVAPPFRTQQFGGNVSGPLGKKASFFIDAERRMIDDNDIVNATIPTANFLGTTIDHSYYATPQRRTTVSPRIDYALGANHTLSFRYSYLDNQRILTFPGSTSLPSTTIGNLTLPSAGSTSSSTDHSFQVVETSVLSPKAINETHINVERDYSNSSSVSSSPLLSVSQSFSAGGSGLSSSAYANNYDHQFQTELQNYTSLTLGAHTVKAGIRIRAGTYSELTPSNFNGSYSFLGGTFSYAPIANLPDAQGLAVNNGLVSLTSIQQFLFTEQLLAGNLPLGGFGPSKYSVSTGNPNLSFYQADYGPFIQDDWKARPNLTMSFGLRYEAQNDIPTHNSWAPRFGFAWSPGAKANSNSRPKTVLRGGWGIFYDRFAAGSVENALRYSTGGGLLQTYSVDNPVVSGTNFFANPLPASQLANATTAGASQKYQIDSNLQAPSLMQLAIGVDRQLFSRTTLSVNFVNSRGNHDLRTVDINSPLPLNGEYPLQISQCIATNGPGSCPPLIRPYSFNGDIYDYQSSGTFKQTQLLFNVNTQFKWGSLFARYSYNNAHSDTDGLGSLPSNPYNFSQDWGRSSLDIANNFFLSGSIAAKWGLRFSPFVQIHSGSPYNLSTGTDLYLQNAETARPSFYITTPPTDIGAAAYRTFLNATPAFGSVVVPRNFLTGPGFIGVNLRVSKTWGFGTTKFTGPSGGSRGGGGGGGGGRGGGGFGGGGFGGGETTQHRYNVTVSLNARNLLNHENLGSPTGVMTSPYFLQSTGIAGGFGPESVASNQRRIDIQLRFAF